MRCVPTACLLVLLNALAAPAQIRPISNGSCRVSASGLESCNWMSGISVAKANPSKIPNTSEDGQTKLFVTRYILAPGAPLKPPVEGNALVVGMTSGELANENKSPQNRLYVTNGSVILMPKQEPYLLRNVGKQSLEVLLIELR